MRWGRIIKYAAVLVALRSAWGFLAATHAVGLLLSQLTPLGLGLISYLGLVGGSFSIAVLGVMAYRASERVLLTMFSVLLAATIAALVGLLTNALLPEHVIMFQFVFWPLGLFYSLVYVLPSVGIGFGLRALSMRPTPALR